MKVKDLVRALGDIDDKYIVEIDEPIKKEKRSAFQNNVKKVNFRNEVIIMDRKILEIAAIVILVVVIFSVGMINKSKNGGESSSTELVQIANPITEVKSKEEMKKYLGFDVPVLNKEVESYIVIGEGKYATHARVIYKDGS